MRITDYRGPLLDRYGSSPPSSEYCRDCGHEDCPWAESGHPECMRCHSGIGADCECEAPLWECPGCDDHVPLKRSEWIEDWTCEGGHKLCG